MPLTKLLAEFTCPVLLMVLLKNRLLFSTKVNNVNLKDTTEDRDKCICMVWDYSIKIYLKSQQKWKIQSYNCRTVLVGRGVQRKAEFNSKNKLWKVKLKMQFSGATNGKKCIGKSLRTTGLHTHTHTHLPGYLFAHCSFSLPHLLPPLMKTKHTVKKKHKKTKGGAQHKKGERKKNVSLAGFVSPPPQYTDPPTPASSGPPVPPCQTIERYCGQCNGDR